MRDGREDGREAGDKRDKGEMIKNERPRVIRVEPESNLSRSFKLIITLIFASNTVFLQRIEEGLRCFQSGFLPGACADTTWPFWH